MVNARIQYRKVLAKSNGVRRILNPLPQVRLSRIIRNYIRCKRGSICSTEVWWCCGVEVGDGYLQLVVRNNGNVIL